MNSNEKNNLIRYQGQNDFPLMDEGLYSMQKIAEKMKSLQGYLHAPGKPSGYMAEQSLKDIIDR